MRLFKTKGHLVRKMLHTVRKQKIKVKNYKKGKKRIWRKVYQNYLELIQGIASNKRKFININTALNLENILVSEVPNEKNCF